MTSNNITKATTSGNAAIIQQMMFALNGAFKKILLYPSHHAICQSALSSLKEVLDQCFVQNEVIVIKIDQGQIFYNDEVIHEGPMNEENLAFILFRDGIYMLEFHKSIETWEIYSFLQVLQRHQILTEDAENDIVTALWELDFPHLDYSAEDVGFDTGEEFEIPDLDNPETFADAQDFSPADLEDNQPASSPDTPVYDWKLQNITPEDRDYLHKLIVEDENLERIEYVLHILLYVLEQQKKPGNFSDVMPYLYEKLMAAMKEKKYKSVYTTLKRLKITPNPKQPADHWSTPLIKDFFDSLSKPEFINVLKDDLERVDGCGSETLSDLKRALLLLNPDAVENLAPLLLETKSVQTKKMLMTVIGALGEQNYSCFDSLLSASDTDLVKLLIHVMGFMKNEQSIKRLHELLQSASAPIRKEALTSVFRRNSNMASELLWLLNDPDEGVQRLFLRFADQKRDLKTEKSLLAYLKKKRFRSGSKDILFRVHTTLGKCGSDESLPFLRKNLFLFPFFGILRSKKSLRYQVSISTLRELKTSNAEALLKRVTKKIIQSQ